MDNNVIFMTYKKEVPKFVLDRWINLNPNYTIEFSLDDDCIKFLQDNSWRDEINEFAAAIIENKPIMSGTSYDALETMKLVFSIYYNDEIWREQFKINNPNQ